MEKKIKKKLPKGLKDFLIKSTIFILFFVTLQLITMGLAALTFLPSEIKPLAMDDLAESAFFMLIIFIALNKDSFLKLKKFKTNLLEKIISLLLIVIIFPLYFKYKFFMLNNIELVKHSLWFYSSIEFIILGLILLSCLILVFGYKFIIYFVKKYKKSLLLLVIGTILVYIIIRQFQKLWFYLSAFVAKSVYFLLDFIGNPTLTFSQHIPFIKFNYFAVKIAQTCSGIDSIFLFTALYVGILIWDWKVLNKKKAISLFFVGVIGAFLLNIIRIFLLILIGAYISPTFSLHAFHTNAAALLFLIYFFIFWSIFYKWMKKPKLTS